MEFLYYLIASLLIIASILPLIPSQHRIFRVFDFGRIQILILQIVVFAAAFFFFGNEFACFWIVQTVLLVAICYGAMVLLPYTKIYPAQKTILPSNRSRSISIISVNVFQHNQEHQRLISLIDKRKPDMLLTMESDANWGKSLTVLEADYPHQIKVPLENTYGMHFYSKVAISYYKVNYFIADDIPSLQIKLKTLDGYSFTLFGVHPPPPSPTEERTSKERDGELLSVAKRTQKTTGPVVVAGDFNNVAWSRSSKLFKKTSGLIDPRIGRGFYSTFHARYWFLRFPIDLFFHSEEVFIEEFNTCKPIGSDHLPLYCKFFLSPFSSNQESKVESLEPEEKEVVNEMIEDGIEEEGNRE